MSSIEHHADVLIDHVALIERICLSELNKNLHANCAKARSSQQQQFISVHALCDLQGFNLILTMQQPHCLVDHCKSF